MKIGPQNLKQPSLILKAISCAHRGKPRGDVSTFRVPLILWHNRIHRVQWKTCQYNTTGFKILEHLAVILHPADGQKVI